MTFPVFIFIRAEVEGFGTLYCNIFGRKRPTRRQRIEIEEIVHGLRADAAAGLLGEVKVGWPGVGLKPANGVDTNDAFVMATWFARAYVVDLKLDLESAPATHDEDAEGGYSVSAQKGR